MLLNKIYNDKYYRLSGQCALSLEWIYWYILFPIFDLYVIVYCIIKKYYYDHSRPHRHQPHRERSHRTTPRPREQIFPKLKWTPGHAGQPNNNNYGRFLLYFWRYFDSEYLSSSIDYSRSAIHAWSNLIVFQSCYCEFNRNRVYYRYPTTLVEISDATCDNVKAVKRANFKGRGFFVFIVSSAIKRLCGTRNR